jgi:transposase InsO family protein
MSLRRLIVEVSVDDLNVTAFCAEHGVSTWFFYDLRRRYASGGVDAIEPRSRAPKRVANRTAAEVEELIVTTRKRLEDVGLDAGPVSIADRLHDDGVEPVPSASTIWRLLRRRGFIVADPSKAPVRGSMRRFVAARANECWQADDTNWELADGTPVKIINVVDDCSRVLIASRAVSTTTAAAVFDAFADGAARWGWPERILFDNARAHHALHDTLAALGVAVRHPRPYHPQTCGKVERFHLTLKKFLDKHDRSITLDALQTQLDEFAVVYNTDRRHRSLGRRIPADVWSQTPKSGPANQPLQPRTEIHHVTVTKDGTVYIGARYCIVIGATYTGQPATIALTGNTCHIFVDGRIARTLTIDPTRRVQPLKRPYHLP